MAISGRIHDGVVVEIGFEGRGCVISVAAASKLTDYALHKKVKELVVDLQERLIVELLGIKLGPNRFMCGNLPLIALRRGLRGRHKV